MAPVASFMAQKRRKAMAFRLTVRPSLVRLWRLLVKAMRQLTQSVKVVTCAAASPVPAANAALQRPGLTYVCVGSSGLLNAKGYNSLLMFCIPGGCSSDVCATAMELVLNTQDTGI